MADSIYSDLRDERREIRLLFLNAGHPQDAIVATLMVTSLNWAHEYWTPEYETLSYVWGDPLMTRAISLNDQPYHITENLEAALRSLRHAGRVRILWIDALCINQNDPREREHQITLMRDIFEGCASCVVWLGDEDEETERIFDPLYWMQDNLHVHRWPCFDGEIGRHVSEDDLTHGVGPALKPLQNLLNRSVSILFFEVRVSFISAHSPLSNMYWKHCLLTPPYFSGGIVLGPSRSLSSPKLTRYVVAASKFLSISWSEANKILLAMEIPAACLLQILLWSWLDKPKPYSEM